MYILSLASNYVSTVSSRLVSIDLCTQKLVFETVFYISVSKIVLTSKSASLTRTAFVVRRVLFLKRSDLAT